MIILRQKEFGRLAGSKKQVQKRAKEFFTKTGNSKTAREFNDKYLASFVKPGYSVPKKDVREYLHSSERTIDNIKSKENMLDWSINTKAAYSGGMAGTRSTHYGRQNPVHKSNRFYDHRDSNVKENKDTIKFVREQINNSKNKLK